MNANAKRPGSFRSVPVTESLAMVEQQSGVTQGLSDWPSKHSGATACAESVIVNTDCPDKQLDGCSLSILNLQ